MYALSVPAIYSLELTAACNNHCPGCSNIYNTNRLPPPMNGSMWVTLLATFAQEAVQLRLTGGEPTLHPDFFQILEAATHYDAWVTLFTNGCWVRPHEFIRRMRGWPHISGMLISLHGAAPDTHEAFTRVRGSFARAAAGIRLAVENGIQVALSTIITRQNCNDLESILALAHELGARRVVFNRYLGPPLPGIEPTLRQLADAINRIETLLHAGEPVKYGIGIPLCFSPNGSDGCLAGVAYASVDPWGNLRPCAHSPTVVGSLCNSTMKALWNGDAMNAWRMLMPPECPSCAAYAICHGGCRAVQELRVDGRDPLRREPLSSYTRATPVRALPAQARPVASVRLRPEPTGYAILGHGQVLLVHTEARNVIEACNGTVTFAQLVEQFGQKGLDLLGELWEAGMLTV